MRIYFLLAAFVIGLDQLSKLAVEYALNPGVAVVVNPYFNLNLAYNPGAAFSLLGSAGGWQRWLFMGIALLASGWISAWLWRLRPGLHLQAAGLALILGGAVGNLIDRIIHGVVIDFIQWHYGAYYWPTFNLADAAISVGVALLLLDFWRNPQST